MVIPRVYIFFSQALPNIPHEFFCHDEERWDQYGVNQEIAEVPWAHDIFIVGVDFDKYNIVSNAYDWDYHKDSK